MNCVTPYALCWTVGTSSSPEGEIVTANLMQAFSSELQSAVYNGRRLSALADLHSFYSSAAKENWDGEGALPVNGLSYANARRFLSLMPSSWAKPEINGDPDGEVAVEWDVGSRRRFSISIGPDDRVSYAWLNGAERGHGTDIFVNEIPSSVTTQVNRLVEG